MADPNGGANPAHFDVSPKNAKTNPDDRIVNQTVKKTTASSSILPLISAPQWNLIVDANPPAIKPIERKFIGISVNIKSYSSKSLKKKNTTEKF